MSLGSAQWALSAPPSLSVQGPSEGFICDGFIPGQILPGEGHEFGSCGSHFSPCPSDSMGSRSSADGDVMRVSLTLVGNWRGRKLGRKGSPLALHA